MESNDDLKKYVKKQTSEVKLMKYDKGRRVPIQEPLFQPDAKKSNISSKSRRSAQFSDKIKVHYRKASDNSGKDKHAIEKDRSGYKDYCNDIKKDRSCREVIKRKCKIQEKGTKRIQDRSLSKKDKKRSKSKVCPIPHFGYVIKKRLCVRCKMFYVHENDSQLSKK